MYLPNTFIFHIITKRSNTHGGVYTNNTIKRGKTTSE